MGGGDVAELRDVPLMLPFCDTILVSNVFMLTDSQCCGQYRALSISCSCNSGKDLKDERGWIGGINAFLQALPFLFPRLPLTRFASL